MLNKIECLLFVTKSTVKGAWRQKNGKNVGKDTGGSDSKTLPLNVISLEDTGLINWQTFRSKSSKLF